MIKMWNGASRHAKLTDSIVYCLLSIVRKTSIFASLAGTIMMSKMGRMGRYDLLVSWDLFVSHRTNKSDRSNSYFLMGKETDQLCGMAENHCVEKP